MRHLADAYRQRHRESAVIHGDFTHALDDTTERARVTLMGAGSQNLTQFDARLDEIAVVIDTRLQALDGSGRDWSAPVLMLSRRHIRLIVPGAEDR